ncbi:unnamed protein product [Phytophthora lilii]|uniref:Unnamed protein product n=1 Tax=Phytophthora lilii TaxID=2077276 RepID=A0A9W6XL91_9STRA|nr:unnamed protein product [Phytophthora lilii]
MAAARRHYTTETPVKPVVDNNKLWRRSEVMPVDRRSNNESYDITSSAKDKLNTPSWEMGVHVEEDPSGLSPALRKQVEDNWQRRNQTLSQRRQTPSRKFVHDDFSASFASQLDWPTKTKKSEAQNGTSKARSGTTFVKASTMSPTRKLAPYSCDNLASVTTPTSTISFHTPSAAVQRLHSSHQQPPPPRPLRSNGTFQPTLRVNL